MSFFASSEFTSAYLSQCLENILYGFYSGIFIQYLQYQASEERTNTAKNTISYAICVLYCLSTVVITGDIVTLVIDPDLSGVSGTVIIVGSALFGCCDFIAQSILIYRCWIVWHRNIRVVIIPAILAIAFLAMWITGSAGQFIGQGHITGTGWSNDLNIISLVISMTVNALVTGLIVFKIFKVFREVRATSDQVTLGATGGTKLRSIMFIIIESGMALFSIQFARLVITIVTTEAAYETFQFIAAIHQMLNGITPTIILVRVSMGLSFDDETSLVEAAESVLRFASDDPDPNQETGSFNQDQNLRSAPEHEKSVLGMGSVQRERGDDDEVGGSEDLQTVNR